MVVSDEMKSNTIEKHLIMSRVLIISPFENTVIDGGRSAKEI
jgi:hypothetical protein